MASGWELVTKKTKSWLEAQNFQPHFQPLGRGKELEIELTIDPARVLKPPLKPFNDGLWRASGLMNTSMWQEVGTSQLRGDRSSCAWNLSRPYSMYLFIGLFIGTFYNILYNKPVMISKALSWVFVEMFSSKLSNLRSRLWEHRISSWLVDLGLASGVCTRGRLVGLSP